MPVLTDRRAPAIAMGFRLRLSTYVRSTSTASTIILSTYSPITL